MNKLFDKRAEATEVAFQEYTAACHCRKVRIKFAMKFDKIWLCNCTICQMRSGHWIYFPEENLQILSGRGHLQAYLYNTRTCKNMFCNNCGIHVYAHARSLPGHCAIKVECIEEFPEHLIQEHLCDMDGYNWSNGQEQVRKAEGITR